ncbi:hypothetical protein BDB01DRAFT_791525 [Pilobolus umbonatus]|nr:hypothetical protein BDB01DRAFT_791525 [Pilobolus umbonatus]
MPSLKTSTPSVKCFKNAMPSTHVLCEGYLMKQNHGRYKSWAKRYFVLYNGDLRYYKNKSDNNAHAVISLNHYNLASIDQSIQQKSNIFCLISDDDNKYDWPDYYLQANNEENLQLWIECLQSCMFQPMSVLDKWLDRLDISIENKSHSLSNTSSYSNTSEIIPASLLSISKEDTLLSSTTDQTSSSVKSYKSLDSLNTLSDRSCYDSMRSELERRPSEKVLSSKLFSWPRMGSSSSLLSSSKSIHSITHDIDLGSTETLVLPLTTKSVTTRHMPHYDSLSSRHKKSMSEIYSISQKPLSCTYSQ